MKWKGILAFLIVVIFVCCKKSYKVATIDPVITNPVNLETDTLQYQMFDSTNTSDTNNYPLYRIISFTYIPSTEQYLWGSDTLIKFGDSSYSRRGAFPIYFHSDSIRISHHKGSSWRSDSKGYLIK